MDRWGKQERRAVLAVKEVPEMLEKEVMTDLQEMMETMVMGVLSVSQDYPDLRVQEDSRDPREKLGPMVNQDTRVLLERVEGRESLAVLDPGDSKETWDLQDKRGSKDQLGHRDTLAMQAQWVKWENMEAQETEPGAHPDSPEFQGHKDCVDPMEQKASLVPKAMMVNQETQGLIILVQEKKVAKGPRVTEDPRAERDPQVPQDHQDPLNAKYWILLSVCALAVNVSVGPLISCLWWTARKVSVMKTSSCPSSLYSL